MKHTDAELAYAAAILDGEGYVAVCTYKNRKHPDGNIRPLIVVSNTDDRLLIWLKDKFGGCFSKGSRSKGSKRDIYVWRITGAGAASCLELLLPYLIIKYQQAQDVLRYEHSGDKEALEALSYIRASRDLPQPRVISDEVSEKDLAYAAGMLDGEGSICLGKGGKRDGIYQLQVTVCNTDRRVLDWLIKKFGGSLRSVETSNRTRYVWMRSRRGAESFLRAIMHYTVIKAAQIDVVLAYQATLLQPGAAKRVTDAVIAERINLKRLLQADRPSRGPKSKLMVTVQ